MDDNFIDVTRLYVKGFDFADMDGDNDFDVILCEPDGVTHYMINDGTAQNAHFTEIITKPFLPCDVGQFSSPAFFDEDNDGDFDLFMLGKLGISFFENEGSASVPKWTFREWSYKSILPPGYGGPEFADIDSDGDCEMFLGTNGSMDLRPGAVMYLNTGTQAEPQWSWDSVLIAESFNSFAHPALVDIDDDKDFDLFIQNTSMALPEPRTFMFVENTGTATKPVWAVQYTKNYACGSPAFFDYDNDGDYDLFSSGQEKYLSCYENTGTAQLHTFSDPFVGDSSIILCSPYANGSYTGSTPVFVDIDNDGDKDLFSGCNEGGLLFYRNDHSVQTKDNASVAYGTGKLCTVRSVSNAKSLSVTYELYQPSRVKLQVMNLKGIVVKSLVDCEKKAGNHSVNWDKCSDKGEMISSGFYIIQFMGERYTESFKVVLF